MRTRWLHWHLDFSLLNSISAGALPQTPLGELTMLPRHPTRLGKWTHPSHSPPLDAKGASLSTPKRSRAWSLRHRASLDPLSCQKLAPCLCVRKAALVDKERPSYYHKQYAHKSGEVRAYGSWDMRANKHRQTDRNDHPLPLVP